jgi:hypothetical protein
VPDLRTCPLCRSRAIRAIRRTELEERRTRVVLQCGACGEWRGRDLPRRQVRALDRRLRRDRERMARLLRGLEPDSIDAEPREAERR